MTPDDLYLDIILRLRFGNIPVCPKCHKSGRLYKITGRPSYACVCKYHVNPLSSTLFVDSHTPLTTWFKALELVSTGASAKEIERQCKVTYKTAWRMKKQLLEGHL